jgi:hypothetical protein
MFAEIVTYLLESLHLLLWLHSRLTEVGGVRSFSFAQYHPLLNLSRLLKKQFSSGGNGS